MKLLRSAGLVVLLIALPAAADNASDGPTGIKPLSGHYTFYGRDVGDWGAPTARDTKIWLEITGPAARRMYRELGPKSVALCGYRQRNDLACMEDGAGGYTCQIGIDLRKGKSVGGTVC